MGLGHKYLIVKDTFQQLTLINGKAIRTMRHLAIIPIIVLLASGCVEPYPVRTVSDVRYNDLPVAVKRAFQRDFPDARIIGIERSTFESRMAGFPRTFRIFFARNESSSQHVVYDSAGKQQVGLDFWFEQAPADRSPGNRIATQR